MDAGGGTTVLEGSPGSSDCLGAGDHACLVKCTFGEMYIWWNAQTRFRMQRRGQGLGRERLPCMSTFSLRRLVCLDKLSAGSLLTAEELAPGKSLGANNSKWWRREGSLRCCSPLQGNIQECQKKAHVRGQPRRDRPEIRVRGLGRGDRRRKPVVVPKYCRQVLLTPKQQHPSPPKGLGGWVQRSMAGGYPGGAGFPTKDQKGNLLLLKKNLACTLQRVGSAFTRSYFSKITSYGYFSPSMSLIIPILILSLSPTLSLPTIKTRNMQWMLPVT